MLEGICSRLHISRQLLLTSLIGTLGIWICFLKTLGIWICFLKIAVRGDNSLELVDALPKLADPLSSMMFFRVPLDLGIIDRLCIRPELGGKCI